MRIGRVEIQAWGGLSDTTLDLDHAPLVVILGPNESGKTTLRDVIETALFGFRPAALERHPLAPWDGRELGANLHARLDDDSAIVVRRQLGRTARGQLELNGDPLDLRNGPLPWTAELGRDGWRDWLAPPAELRTRHADDARVDLEAAWNAASSGGLRRSARETVEQLEAQAATLWRPDRRGRPRARELADELRELRKTRREAVARARELDDLASTLRHAERDAEPLRGERAELSRRLRRSATHGARLARARARDDLRGQAARLLGDVAPPARVDRVLLRRRRLVARTHAALLAARRDLARLDASRTVSDRDRQLVEHADELRRLAARAQACRDESARVAAASDRATAWNALATDLAGSLLTTPLDGPTRRALMDLPGDALRGALSACEDAVAAHEHALRDVARLESAAGERPLDDGDDGFVVAAPDEAASRARLADLDALIQLEQGSARMPSSEATMGLAAVGCVALVVSAVTPLPGWIAQAVPAVAAFAWLSAASLGLRALRCRRQVDAARAKLELDDRDAVEVRLQLTEALADGRSRERRVATATEQAAALATARLAVDTRGDERDRRRREVDHLLGAIPLNESTVRGRDLAHDLARLADTLRQLDAHDGRDRAARAESEELQAHFAALDLPDDVDNAQDANVGADADAVETDPLARLIAAGVALERAWPAVERAKAVRAEHVAARDEHARARSEHERATRDLESLERLLATLDPGGDPDAGLARAREAQQLQRRAEALQRELDEDLDGADLADLERELAADTLRLPDTSAYAEWQARLDDVEAELRAAEERRAQLRARLEPQDDTPDIADLDGRIAALEAEQTEVRREHDRLRLLAAVLREAGERWRATTREPVLARASHWATRLTDGRWRELRLQEDARGTRLLARTGGEGPLVPVAPPLSRGTREQLRLALRLALAESLEGEQPLPLVLDEAFASWDDRRTGLGAELLARVGRRRQVLVLTCRAGLAERLASDTGARVVTLGELS